VSRPIFLIDRTGPANADLSEALDQSFRFGGPSGQRRYRILLNRCIRDIAANPMRLGAHCPEGTFWLYHSRHSKLRAGSTEARVRSPRHIFVYHIDQSLRRVTILRVLHDAMDIHAHIEAASRLSSQTDSS
jgi:plasmid stabilization system protein ParE